MTVDISDYSLGKNYLSFGGGVNSVALMLWLIDHGIEFEAVFSNHGGDYPETYDYLNMLLDRGYPITVLDARRNVRGKLVDLYGECHEYKMIPSPYRRWCTYRYKIEPITKYCQKPAFMFLGISAEESHRARRDSEYIFGIVRDYPLVDHNIDRNQCKEIIRSHDLPIPPKSGCYFCPFMKKNEIQQLYHRCDDLFDKALILEKQAVEKSIKEGKQKIFYLHNSNLPLEVIAMTNQVELFEELHPCACHE